MKQSNISFDKGIHRTPSIGAAGELSEAMNLIPSNGELQNIQQPISNGATIADGSLIYIHKNDIGTTYENYILKKSDGIYFGSTKLASSCVAITSVGNVLYLTDSNGKPRYLLFKDISYVDLSDGTFNIDARFAIHSLSPYVQRSKSQSITLKTMFTPDDAPYVESWNSVAVVDQSQQSSSNVIVNYNIKKGNVYRIDINITSASTATFKSIKFIKSDGSLYNYRDASETGSTGSSFVLNPLADYIGVSVYFYSQPGAPISKKCIADLYEATSVSEPGSNPSGYYLNDSEENLNSYHAELNKFIASRTELGEFIFPFLVRCAVKLKTGEYVCPSAPVLIEPNTGVVPAMFLSGIQLKDKSTSLSTANSTTFAFTGKLQYFIDNNSLDSLKSKNDLVEGIVIGITEPIYRYRQSGYSEEELSNMISLSTNPPNNSGYFKTGEENIQEYVVQGNYIVTPEKEQSYVDLITSKSTFHVVKEIGLYDIPTDDEFDDLDINGEVLSSLAGIKDIIPDKVIELSSYGAETSIGYNNRLTLAAITENVFTGYHPDCMAGYCVASRKTVSTETKLSKYEFNGSAIRGNETSDSSNDRWLYYPSSNASSITISTTSGAKEYKLLRHPLLNGSYYFVDNCIKQTKSADYHNTDLSPKIFVQNRILTSLPNNPLAKDQDTQSPTGRILGISSSAKALSQGQFGQFPLYAFCDDGIWALEISNTGSISAKQPVSRDVCTVPKSITQLDNAVAFITKEGVKVISGSEVELISEKVHGLNLDESFIQSALTDDFASLYKQDTNNFISQVQNSNTLMSYDYPHQLIHVFIEDNTWHYVYARKTGEWSKQLNVNGAIKAAVPGYPLSTLQFGTSLYQYDTSTDSKRVGFALTRSYAFDDPFTAKMLYDLKLFGQRHSDSMYKVVVYISNDNINWHVLNSLKGRSAKFYRFLILTNMYDTDTLTGMTLLYQERYSHKLR